MLLAKHLYAQDSLCLHEQAQLGELLRVCNTRGNYTSAGHAIPVGMPHCTGPLFSWLIS